MTVKITNHARIKDYKAILGNTVSIIGGFDEKLSLLDAKESILKKALRCGHGYIIEDTTLTINGEICNTVTCQDYSYNNQKAVWTTIIAYHSVSMIHFYEGIVNGHIKLNPSSNTKKLFIGDVFVPDGHELTISEIEQRNNVNFTNARKLALKKLLYGQSYHVEIVKPASIPTPGINAQTKVFA